MNASRIVPLCLLGAALLGPAALTAQSSKPDRGKVDGVEREARRANRNGSDDDGGGFWLLELIFNIFRSEPDPHRPPAEPAPPPGPGRGYGPYPYADSTDADTTDAGATLTPPFVREGVTEGRGFNTLSATYFDDNAIGGSLRAGQLSWESAHGPLSFGLEYTLYREPTQTDTDYLHTFRAGVDALPRLGRIGFGRIGLAVRGVVLDNGAAAAGPELEVGVQAFPGRPWGVAATARGGIIQWNQGGSSGMAELTAQGSYFVGRVELMAGWRYLRIGAAEPFNGPTAGVRVWF